jgi:hypothetical protein
VAVRCAEQASFITDSTALVDDGSTAHEGLNARLPHVENTR